MRQIFYKDDNGEHVLETEKTKTKPMITKPNILHFTTADTPLDVVSENPLPTMPARELTDEQRQEIFEANEAMEKKPVLKLEKTFYQNDTMYEIIERTPEFALLKATQLLRNPDGSLPALMFFRNRKKGASYWTVAKIVTIQPDELDFNGISTGIKKQKQEFAHINQNIELTVVNDKGIPIPDKIGFNVDFERVRTAYLQSIAIHNQDVLNKEAKLQGIALKQKQQIKVSDFRGEIRELLLTTRSELKSLILDMNSVESAMKSKRIIELASNLALLKTINESL